MNYKLNVSQQCHTAVKKSKHLTEIYKQDCHVEEIRSNPSTLFTARKVTAGATYQIGASCLKKYVKQFEDRKERCKGLQGFRNELERQLQRTERDEGETHKKHHSSEERLKGDRMTIA